MKPGGRGHKQPKNLRVVSRLRPAKKTSPTYLMARELWKRGLFTDAIKQIHEKLQIRVNYTNPPEISYNQNMVIGHPELIVDGLLFARKSIDLFNLVNRIPSNRAGRAMDKISPKAHNLSKKVFVEEIPKKKLFERVAGTSISDERFKQMINATSSKDLLTVHSFQLLMVFGTRSDLPRLKRILNDSFLYNWTGYAKDAINEISQRRPK